jgi:hypothetical protein
VRRIRAKVYVIDMKKFVSGFTERKVQDSHEVAGGE